MNVETEKNYLANYDPAAFPIPLLTVDIVVFSYMEEQLQILLTQRESHPCQGQWALPGGFVKLEEDRDLLATARRKLEEKTGIQGAYLEQVASVGNADRDPRGWSTTIVHMALVPAEQSHPGVNLDRLQWVPLTALPELAFDHNLLIGLACERFRNRTLYTSLPTFLLPETFTLSQLQKAYEAVLEQPLTTKAFRTRMQASEAILPTDDFFNGGGRPARLYQGCDAPYIFKRSLENALPL